MMYVVNGAVVTETQLLMRAPSVERESKETLPSYHKGWKVVGHPPGAIEAAEKAARRMADDKRRPFAFDPERWALRARKRCVRARPYGVESAATQCAELARRAGWTHVEVVEVVKGKP